MTIGSLSQIGRGKKLDFLKKCSHENGRNFCSRINFIRCFKKFADDRNFHHLRAILFRSKIPKSGNNGKLFH